MCLRLGRRGPLQPHLDGYVAAAYHHGLSLDGTALAAAHGPKEVHGGHDLKGSRVKLGRGQGAEADKLTYQTAQPDIFVGGDVYTGPKFAIDAIAAGKEAAVSLHRFVQPNTSLTIGRNRRDFIELDKTNALIPR